MNLKELILEAKNFPARFGKNDVVKTLAVSLAHCLHDILNVEQFGISAENGNILLCIYPGSKHVLMIELGKDGQIPQVTLGTNLTVVAFTAFNPGYPLKDRLSCISKYMDEHK